MSQNIENQIENEIKEFEKDISTLSTTSSTSSTPNQFTEKDEGNNTLNIDIVCNAFNELLSFCNKETELSFDQLSLNDDNTSSSTSSIKVIIRKTDRGLHKLNVRAKKMECRSQQLLHEVIDSINMFRTEIDLLKQLKTQINAYQEDLEMQSMKQTITIKKQIAIKRIKSLDSKFTRLDIKSSTY